MRCVDSVCAVVAVVVVDDTRFAVARLERDIRCNGCGRWCQGNEAGCFQDAHKLTG